MQRSALIQLYENFVPKWGKESVDLLTLYIDEKSNSNMKEELKDVATKADLKIVKEDVQTLKVDVNALKVDVQALKVDVNTLKVDVQALKVDVTSLKVDVTALKADVQYLKDDVQDIKRTIRLLEKQSNEFVVLLKDTKAEMLKWMLVFWASHLTLLLGYLIFLK